MQGRSYPLCMCAKRTLSGHAGMCAQVLDLSGAEGSESGGEEGSDISGLSFTPSGRRLYVGLEGGPGQGIAAFDVNMLSRLTFGAAQLC
jgi:hypothetical protein